MKRASIVLLEAQRMDSVVRGPVHSLFTYLINGLVSIRAYEKVDFFRRQFMNESELSANVSFTYFSVNRWLAYRLDLGCLFMTIFTAIACISFKGTIESDLLTFSLQIITDVAVFFSVSIR